MRSLWLSALLAFALGAPSANAEQIVVSSVHMSDYPSVQAMALMGRLLSASTGGRLHVVVLPKKGTSDLFDVQEVRNGKIAMAAISVAQFNNTVPETIALSLPYLFQSKAHVRSTLDGPIGQEVLAALDRAGLVALGFYDVGDRSIFTIRRPIRRLEDMKGLRVRALHSELWQAALRAMGARPVLLPYESIAAAFKSGLIDAAEDNWTAYISSRESEAAAVYSLTRHTRAPEVLVVSRELWQRLSLQDRNLMRSTAKESARWLRQQLDEREATATRAATAAGIEVVADVDRKSFADAMEPLYSTYVADPAVKELVDRIRSDIPTP